MNNETMDYIFGHLNNVGRVLNRYGKQFQRQKKINGSMTFCCCMMAFYAWATYRTVSNQQKEMDILKSEVEELKSQKGV